MGIKKGTKLTDTPKDAVVRFRADKETVEKLDKIASVQNATRSDVIRKGIEIQFDSLSK